MKRFQAVSCVISKGDAILMLKRSQKVRTNRGLWSVVAGEVTGDPLTTAFAEIEEETGLYKSDVALVKGGKPLEVSLSPNSITTVHPFLFYTGKAEIRLNWEHDEYRWATLDEIRGLPIVPRFLDMLTSLGFERLRI
jgi:8-oxo-dGTP pyrophosphatase MutT (NUDIX family)